MVVLPAGATRAWGERGGGQPVEAAPAGCCAGRGITTGDAPSCSTRHAAGDTHLGSRRPALAVTPAHGKPPAKEVLPQRPNAGWCEWEVGTGGGWRGLYSGRSFQPRPATAGGMSRKEDRRERGGASGLAFPPGPPFRPPSSSASLSSKAGRLVGDRDEIAWGSQPPPSQTGETRSPLRLERKRQ